MYAKNDYHPAAYQFWQCFLISIDLTNRHAYNKICVKIKIIISKFLNYANDSFSSVW